LPDVAQKTKVPFTLSLLTNGSPYSAGYVPPPAFASSHLTLASHLACQSKWRLRFKIYMNWILCNANVKTYIVSLTVSNVLYMLVIWGKKCISNDQNQQCCGTGCVLAVQVLHIRFHIPKLLVY